MQEWIRTLTAGLVLVAMVAVTDVSAKSYEGSLPEVLDAVSRDVPEAQVGIDPRIFHELTDRQVKAEVGESWGRDLNELLKREQLTSIGLRGYSHRMVTNPAALNQFKGFALLGEGKFKAAEEAFDDALQAEPDNVQLIALKRIGRDLTPLYDELLKRREFLDSSLDKRDDKMESRFVRYVKAFAGFWVTLNQDVEVISETGVDAELLPLQELANEVLRAHSKIMARVGRRVNDDEFDRVVELVKQLQKNFDDGYLLSKAAADKAEQLVTKAEGLMAENKNAEALVLLLQCVDSDPANLRGRVHLSWLLAWQRQSQRAAHLAALTQAQALPKQEQTDRWNARVSNAIQRQDVELGRIYSSLYNTGKFDLPLTEATRKGLERLLAGPGQGGQVGVVDGLVTAGGHYSGGEVFPFSVTLSQRRDLSSYHELVVNDLAQTFDPYMLVSFQQAFGWLDQTAGNILYNYRITLHFKDMESAKGGDSLGAALGTAGYSALYQLPTRPTVTMTGSIRAYGGIGPVGGIPAKMQAAIAAGKRTMIVPADNRADLLALSEDSFDQIRILLADTINVYLIQALDGARPREETAPCRLAEAWYLLARDLERIGRYDEAHGVYRRIQAAVPYDYSTGRRIALLEAAGVPATEPAWLEAFTLEVAVERMVAPHRAAVAAIFAGAAATELAADRESTIGNQLLSAALLVDDSQRDALLLRAKLTQNLPITKPAKLEDKKATAKRLLEVGTVLREDPSPAAAAEADLFLALVLSYFDPTNETALLALGKRVERGGGALDVPTQLLALERLLGRGGGTFALTPLPVKQVPKSQLPGAGVIWGEEADAVASTEPGLLPPVGAGAGEEDKGGFVADAEDAGGEAEDAGGEAEAFTAGEGDAADAREDNVLQLDGAVEDVKVVDGGNYLACKLLAEAKIQIVDVRRRRSLGSIETTNEEVVYGAGGRLVVVYDAMTGKINSYDITNGRRVGTTMLPTGGVITAISMGAENDGVAVVRVAKGTKALDPVHYLLLDPRRGSWTEVSSGPPPHNRSYRDREHLRLSPDGTRLGAWCSSHSPSGIIVGMIGRRTIEISYEHDSESWIMPLGSTRFFVTGTGKVLDAKGQKVKDLSQPLVPDVSGRYIFGIGSNGVLDVYSADSAKKVATMSCPSLAEVELRALQWARPEKANDYTPECNLIPVSRLGVFLHVTPAGVHFNKMKAN